MKSFFKIIGYVLLVLAYIAMLYMEVTFMYELQPSTRWVHANNTLNKTIVDHPNVYNQVSFSLWFIVGLISLQSIWIFYFYYTIAFKKRVTIPLLYLFAQFLAYMSNILWVYFIARKYFTTALVMSGVELLLVTISMLTICVVINEANYMGSKHRINVLRFLCLPLIAVYLTYTFHKVVCDTAYSTTLYVATDRQSLVSLVPAIVLVSWFSLFVVVDCFFFQRALLFNVVPYGLLAAVFSNILYNVTTIYSKASVEWCIAVLVLNVIVVGCSVKILSFIRSLYNYLNTGRPQKRVLV